MDGTKHACMLPQHLGLYVHVCVCWGRVLSESFPPLPPRPCPSALTSVSLCLWLPGSVCFTLSCSPSPPLCPLLSLPCLSHVLSHFLSLGPIFCPALSSQLSESVYRSWSPSQAQRAQHVWPRVTLTSGHMAGRAGVSSRLAGQAEAQR